MKNYNSYKDSGVEWIGEIPSGWEIKRLKWVTQIENSGIWGEDEEFPNSIIVPIPTTGQLSIEGEWYYDKMNLRHLSTEDWEKYKCIRGDIVVVKSSGSSTNIITGKCGFISKEDSEKFGFSNFLLRVRPNKMTPKLVYYFLSSNLTKQRIERMVSSTTYPNLKVDEYSNSELLIPPLSEQQQIVSYLDTKTSLIDSLIEKTKLKIQLLKENRTSLINEVVTKGLNPNVEMKDSGVEWIGEIPSHWNTPQIRYITEILRGKFSHRPRNDERLYDGVYPFIQTGDIVSSGKYLTKYTQTLNEWGYSVSKEFPIGTLVMTISGNIGDVSILKIKSCFPDSIIGFFPKSITSEEYLFYLFTSLKQELIKNSTVSTQMNLNVERVGSIYVTLPPISEQNEIVSYLDEHTQLIDKTISVEERRIDTLKEYRQSLISEVVTGKRKVTTDE
jgi:type I restriction enzyme, S subunit